MAVATFVGDVFINGTLTASYMTLPPNSVGNSQVQSAANISSDKLMGRVRKLFSQAYGSAATAETRAIHVVSGLTGTLKTLKAGCILPCASGATISIDLKKNGVSVLAAAVELNDTHAAYEIVDGMLSSTTVVQDDVLTIVMTVAAGSGTLGQGVFAELMLEEAPQ